jgi:hypothetical protein
MPVTPPRLAAVERDQPQAVLTGQHRGQIRGGHHVGGAGRVREDEVALVAVCVEAAVPDEMEGMVLPLVQLPLLGPGPMSLVVAGKSSSR